MREINKIAVIGAGVMGSGIAAQIANAGVEVLLLDIVPSDAGNRNILADTALGKLLKATPAPLMHPDFINFIKTGNLEDDLTALGECDWIIEVVIERLDIKQAIYATLQQYRKSGSIVSSNTSTLPLKLLVGEQPAEFRQDFLITHFFNPPRYMRLLEIVTGKETDPDQVARVGNFIDKQLGKTLVDCKDTPGFIANRIGTYWLHAAISIAIKNQVSVEVADALLGQPAGVPKTGVFGLVDLVGLDLMPHLFKSFSETLAKDDPFMALGEMPPLIDKLIAEGFTGRKGKGGFYRLNSEGEKEVIDLHSGEYSLAKRPKPAAAKAASKAGLRALISHDSEEGRYAWEVLSGTLTYAVSLLPEIAENLSLIDSAMKLGYNWKQGPFELIDAIGTDWFIERLEADGLSVPPLLRLAEGRTFYRVKNGRLQYLDTSGSYQDIQRPDGVLLLADIKRNTKPLLGNSQASIWDIGDGIACFEFHSKMNSLNPFILGILSKALRKLPRENFKGLILYNEGSNFSVGANLLMLLVAAKLRLSFATRWILRQGQFGLQDMKYANFPVIGAPSGMALGGGCEFLLHCDAIVAHAESYIGLVEAGVGIVPGWGGCKELLLRGKTSTRLKKGPMPALFHAFETIAMAKVSTSAQDAKALLFLRESDAIVMNRDRLLAAAKEQALKMAKSYHPPEKAILKLPGETAETAFYMAVDNYQRQGIVSPHDARIAAELGKVLSGNGVDLNQELDEEHVLQLERDALVSLSKTNKTQARIYHMLSKGKPLRN